MEDREYHVGDWVEFVMEDGKFFEGILDDFDEVAIYVNGLGYPMSSILTMNPQRR